MIRLPYSDPPITTGFNWSLWFRRNAEFMNSWLENLPVKGGKIQKFLNRVLQISLTGLPTSWNFVHFSNVIRTNSFGRIVRTSCMFLSILYKVLDWTFSLGLILNFCPRKQPAWNWSTLSMKFCQLKSTRYSFSVPEWLLGAFIVVKYEQTYCVRHFLPRPLHIDWLN